MLPSNYPATLALASPTRRAAAPAPAPFKEEYVEVMRLIYFSAICGGQKWFTGGIMLRCHKTNQVL
jgi:hypothetical protein